MSAQKGLRSLQSVTETPSQGWGGAAVPAMKGAVPGAQEPGCRTGRTRAGVTSARLRVAGCPPLLTCEQPQACWALRGPLCTGLGHTRSGGNQEGSLMSDSCQISGTIARPGCGCRKPGKPPSVPGVLLLGEAGSRCPARLWSSPPLQHPQMGQWAPIHPAYPNTRKDGYCSRSPGASGRVFAAWRCPCECRTVALRLYVSKGPSPGPEHQINHVVRDGVPYKHVRFLKTRTWGAALLGDFNLHSYLRFLGTCTLYVPYLLRTAWSPNRD